MSSLRSSLVLIVALAASASTLSAQGMQSIGLQGFGGVGNSPEEFDVARDVSFDPGVRFGGGLLLGFDDHLSLRVDVAHISQTGGDTTLGVINESVDFARTYYSAAAQISVPVSSAFSPYVVAGGGIIRLSRDAEEYWYDLSEFGGLGGIGFSYDFPGSQLHVFGEGTGWIYKRQASDETQIDTSVSAGLGYVFPF